MSKCCFCGAKIGFFEKPASLIFSLGVIFVPDADRITYQAHSLCKSCSKYYADALGKKHVINYEMQRYEGELNNRDSELRAQSILRNLAQSSDSITRDNLEKIIKKRNEAYRKQDAAQGAKDYFAELFQNSPLVEQNERYIVRRNSYWGVDCLSINGGLINKDKFNECLWISKDDEYLYLSNIPPRRIDKLLYMIEPGWDKNYKLFYECFEINDYSRLVPKIPLKKIKYFVEEGQVSYSSETISSGNGFNKKGAIKGFAVAGAAGAIIGGMPKSAPSVGSITKTHDFRAVYLYYEGQENEMCCLKYSHEYYDHFQMLIPEKAYSYVIQHASDNPNSCDDEIELIKKLKSLLDIGAITEGEFEAKKAEILKKI